MDFPSFCIQKTVQNVTVKLSRLPGTNSCCSFLCRARAPNLYAAKKITPALQISMLPPHAPNFNVACPRAGNFYVQGPPPYRDLNFSLNFTGGGRVKIETQGTGDAPHRKLKLGLSFAGGGRKPRKIRKPSKTPPKTLPATLPPNPPQPLPKPPPDLPKTITKRQMGGRPSAAPPLLLWFNWLWPWISLWALRSTPLYSCG